MRAVAVVLTCLVTCIAVAQAPSSRAQVGDVIVVGIDDECHVPGFGPCDVAARASLVITAGASDVHVRVLALERSRDLSRTWTALRVRRVQLDTGTPTPGGDAIVVPAGGEHTLGVLHAQQPLGRGVDYRVTLEVDGQRVVVHASEHVLIRHPLPSH